MKLTPFRDGEDLSYQKSQSCLQISNLTLALDGTCTAYLAHFVVVGGGGGRRVVVLSGGGGCTGEWCWGVVVGGYEEGGAF